MTSPAQRIADIEKELDITQKNKATMGHICLLKARLAKLKREIIDQAAKAAGGGSGEGFDVNKTGDARVGLIGFPSVGKSTLLTKMTGVYSKIAAYEFTTLTCIPGIIKYKGAKIQLLDLPGIIEGAKDGKGRGKQVIGVARTCSLILIVIDATKPLAHKRIVERELEGYGIRLNKDPPNITLRKKDKGGISVTSSVALTKLDDDTIKSICHEYKLSNVDVIFNNDADEDDLIDVIEGNRVYVPCIYALNKIDQISIEELEIFDKVPHYVPVCSELEWNLDELMERVWKYLDLVRIYTKPKGQQPDYNAPIVIPRVKRSVEGFCNKIHKQLNKEFKCAVVWGKSVKHIPQRVGKDHVLEDEDVVQIIKRVK